MSSSLLEKTLKYITNKRCERKISLRETSWNVVNGEAILKENLRK
jgi:hypothetical protein